MEISELLSNNYVSWSIIIGGLIFLSYATWVIKNEKDSYEEFGQLEKLGPIGFKVPAWWTKSKDSTLDHICFERTDTHYDWKGHFEFQEKKESLKESLDQFFKNQDIVLDPDAQTYKTKLELTSGETVDAIRAEGCGTLEQNDRIYIDIVVSNLTEEKTVLAYSLSSVLNGALEGPYFDEVLKNISVEKLGALH